MAKKPKYWKKIVDICSRRRSCFFKKVLPEVDFTLAPRPPSSPIRPNGPGGPYKYRDKKKNKQLSEFVDFK